MNVSFTNRFLMATIPVLADMSRRKNSMVALITQRMLIPKVVMLLSAIRRNMSTIWTRKVFLVNMAVQLLRMKPKITDTTLDVVLLEMRLLGSLILERGIANGADTVHACYVLGQCRLVGEGLSTY